MNNRDKILDILHKNKGNYLSGENISSQLGISRTAVWKNINILKDKGYSIESSSRLGHKLISSNDVMNDSEIKRNLKTEFLGQKNIYIFEETDSTNIQAFSLANEGAEEGTIVVAESQTKGRGRLDRKWFSDPGKGLCVSMILRPKIQPIEAPKLTLVTAVAFAEALDDLGLHSYEIKWPNDILVDGKKAAGILAEMKANIDYVDFIIIGFGINLNTDIEALPEEVKDIACSIKNALGVDISRIDFLQNFLYKFENLYNDFISGKFQDILDKWSVKSKILNKKIKISILDKHTFGVVKDINSEGNLIVQTDEGLKVINSGDINYV